MAIKSFGGSVLKKLFLIVFLWIALSALAYPQADDGRQLLNNLYKTRDSLPINTLVADLEVYKPLAGKTEGSSLKLAAKDKLIFKKPNKLKVDSIIVAPGDPMDGKQLSIISDGNNSFMYVSAGQYPVKKQRDPHRPTLNLPPNIQLYPEDADNRCSLEGSAVVNGIPVRVVKIVDTSRNIETTIWIDTKKWVPVKLSEKSPKKKAEGFDTITCTYRDFKKLKDGRWFPSVIEMMNNDQVVQLVIYKAVSVNVQIPDHIFEPMQKFIK